tara:strand:- start:470 stop:667 length:198 start_codon:yes stop_codon:yes gene_type:complete
VTAGHIPLGQGIPVLKCPHVSLAKEAIWIVPTVCVITAFFISSVSNVLDEHMHNDSSMPMELPLV